MNITSICISECVRLPLQAKDKTSAITELVDVLAEAKQLVDRDDVLRAILAREEISSTGVGEGLAVPHGKSRGCRRLTMAVGKPDEPLDFAAKDDRPVEFIVLLASPVDETGPHIQALARISRIWHNPAFREAVRQCTTPDELYAAIEKHQA